MYARTKGSRGFRRAFTGRLVALCTLWAIAATPSAVVAQQRTPSRPSLLGLAASPGLLDVSRANALARGPGESVAAEPDALATSRRRWQRSWRGLMGAGFGVVAAGAVAGGLAVQADREFASQCPKNACDAAMRQSAEPLAQRAERRGLAADTLLVSGGVLLVAAFTLYLLRGSLPASRARIASDLRHSGSTSVWVF